jgi:hypothetical protein
MRSGTNTHGGIMRWASGARISLEDIADCTFEMGGLGDDFFIVLMVREITW